MSDIHTRSSHSEAAFGLSRREMLRRAAGGFPLVALSALLAGEASGQSRPRSPLAPKTAHHPPKTKSVIFLFMGGGPSHLDLFDPKPTLAKYETISVKQPRVKRDASSKCQPSPYQFHQHGAAGIWLSELLPHLATCADHLCVIRSMTCNQLEHSGALRLMLTGDGFFPRPSMGSWVVYGLGSENESLPGFISLERQINLAGKSIYGAGFLPVAYEGALVKDPENPMDNLKLPVPLPVQIRKVEAIRKLNELYRRGREEDSRLDARIAAYELAFRMQTEAPEAFDVSRETPETFALYGLNDKTTEAYGRQCLLARRLVERGVRFVLANVNNQWDSHGAVRDHDKIAAATDRPVAALLKDLKRRGLLEETLVIWGGEFGRTPMAQGAGRDHHPYGFTMWLAGGGVKSGLTYGATDDFGFYATENRVPIHDLQATVLHLLGLDHTRLTYRQSGRDFRLTDVDGEVISDIIA